MSRKESASDWSIDWWKMRHNIGYFPEMQQHRNWRVYGEHPPHLDAVTKLKPDDVCLEIGCGYGQWMVPLSRKVASVAGVDIHPSLADKAREKFADYEAPNCAFHLSDGKTLPFGDGSFSLVYSISVFQHIPRALVRCYFSETDRVLRGEGRAVFHFRFADGGIYSPDIEANHTGDFSVGWTEEEIRAECDRVGWQARVLVMGDSAIVRGDKR